MSNESMINGQSPGELHGQTVNTIELVGTVMLPRSSSRSRANEMHVGIPRTSIYRAQMTRLLVQVEEEDGAVYAIPIDVSISSPERQALVAALQPGDRVRVRGRLRTEPRFDRRFATADNPGGRPTSIVTIAVEDLMHAEPGYVDGSWLRLTGRISVPPAIRRHELAPAEEVSRTSLVVQWIEPSHRPGSQHQHVRIDRIPLDVPLLIEGSTNTLQAGNLVTVEGRLEPFHRPLRSSTNQFVQRHLEELHTIWQAEQATLSRVERAQRERQYLQQLRKLQYEQRLRVRAGYVQLLEGHSISVEEARVAHAEFVVHQKQRKHEKDRTSRR